MKQILNACELGDMIAIYTHDTETGLVGFSLVPFSLADLFTVEGEWQVESLVQVKLLGDNYPFGFSHGHTMRNAQTAMELKYIGQEEMRVGRQTKIITVVGNDKIAANHNVIYDPDYEAIDVFTEVTNISGDRVTLEMVSSFSLSAFSSLDVEERTGDFIIHRLKSKWSAEGLLESKSALEHQLEPSWQRYGVNSLRYGQVGSMPVRGYFPWGVMEDTRYGYCVGAMLKCASSWQMEMYSRQDRLSFSGGIADHEFGHWMKHLEPNELFASPTAVLSTVAGDVDDISYRLVTPQKKALAFNAPLWEKQMPVLFNEFCTSWGCPTEVRIKQILEHIKGKGFEYFIIDAGWYADPELGWESNPGDWELNQEQFPNGLAKAVEAIREAGLRPGIWFEMEVCGKDSKAFHKTEWLQKRDDYTITVGIRRFWDMRKPEVWDYLREKVIGILKKYGFEYIKVDYNDNLGIGVDGAESYGEALRQSVLASQEFFREIKRECPDIIIENCSSGGHRLEPSMMELVSMASFSDAHECVSIPIIAANVHRAILPEQSQIWAVIRKEDSIERITYSMTNTFLGRMCLSGDIEELTSEQWQKIDDAIKFYKKVSHIIRDGKSYRRGPQVLSYNNPTGWQVLLRVDAANSREAIAVFNTFQVENDTTVRVPLLEQYTFELLDNYSSKPFQLTIEGDDLIIRNVGSFEGIVLHLKIRE